MNKKELDDYIFTKLVKDNSLIASAVQWGLVDRIKYDLGKYVSLGNSSVEKLFRYLNNDNGFHKCYCGNNVEFMSFKKGFRKFCSVSCSRKSKSTRNKYEQTMIQRYGDKSSLSKDSIIRKQILKTNKERYGTEYPYAFGNNNWKKMMIDKYGVEHNTALQDVVIKQQQSQKRNFAPKKYETIFGNEIYYQSKPELEFIQACEEENVFVENGPTIKYELDGVNHYYHIDFKTNNSIIEIKSDHHYYREALKSGEIEAKNKVAKIYANDNKISFFFLLDKTKEEYKKLLEVI